MAEKGHDLGLAPDVLEIGLRLLEIDGLDRDDGGLHRDADGLVHDGADSPADFVEDLVAIRVERVVVSAADHVSGRIFSLFVSH